MARFSIYKMYMPIHDCGLAVRPRATTLTSVSLIGVTIVTVNLEQLVFTIDLPHVTAQLLALESCCTVTVTGV